MSAKVVDHVLESLRARGVERVFGCPGDGVDDVDGLLAAWGGVGDLPGLVRARHEEAAALEAVGYAKSGDRLGVCVAGWGPGAAHLVAGLYDAKADRVPVLALVGRTGHAAPGGAYRPESGPHALFEDVAGEFVETVTAPERLPDAIDRAITTAYARRCPTVVILPGDHQEPDHSLPGHAPATAPADTRTPLPSPDALRRVAKVLNAGERAALLVGPGAAGARAEVEELAELLGAGVAKTLLGKDVLSDELPYVTGVLGPSGTRPGYELMRDCDTLLTIGAGHPHPDFLPEPGKARSVRIDLDAQVGGARYPYAYPYEEDVVGDARATLRDLIPLIDEERRSVSREWYDEICAGVRRWDAVLAHRAALDADPLHPEHVARALDPLLPDDAVITCDTGPVATWYARHLRLRGAMRASLSGTLAVPGCAVPYAIGAKFAHPDRPVLALVGDGAMRRGGLAELVAVAGHRHDWDDPRLVVGVWNDAPDVPYAEFARSLGLTGVQVDRPEDVAAAWRAGLGAPGPALVEFRTDPAVPPLPPHATWEQVESAAAALLTGDADAVAVVRQGLKAKAQEFLPGVGRPGDDGGARESDGH
ncbi:thiamine pyrophosphate-binding protein [Streptomyces sp. NPDC005865]|uniref:thiamine pyrophosphate-binding protein n=1 Tax=Streptomyces sp. NPDC005865 TaxID=3155453 RepID=UPI0033F66BCD